jgi:hypothetical protein
VTSFLSEARDHEQRIVDPEREPHPGQHVDREDREAEHVAEHRHERESHDDRRQCDQERDKPGDNRPEDEQEDDQRRGQPELELARSEIVFRELVEVVIYGSLAGDRDREGRARVGAAYGADHIVDPRARFVRHGELQHRRVPILRDE